jgi:Asp-tRNA(Asn)/Glu-tRNA(Gln) amidotransferase A subunit family amidase/monoamine oxidase
MINKILLPSSPPSFNPVDHNESCWVGRSRVIAHKVLAELSANDRSLVASPPHIRQPMGSWSAAREQLPSMFLPNLKKLALLPKGAERLSFQREVHAHWNGLSALEKVDVLELVGRAVLNGEIAPPHKKTEPRLVFDHNRLNVLVQSDDLGLRGPAVTWLRSTLSAMRSNKTLRYFFSRLSEEARDGLSLVLGKKPNKNMIDVDYDYKHFLKFNAVPITLPAEKHGCEVAVVGSGVAAVIAAQMLLQAGARPVIFERNSAIGGRLSSQHYHDEHGNKVKEFSELGAMRFPSWGRTWFFLLKRLGVQSSSNFPNPGKVPTVLHFNGQTINWPVGASTPDSPLFQKIGVEFNQVMDALLLPMDVARKAHDTDKMQELFQSYLDQYSNKTFKAVLIESLEDAGIHWTKEEFDAFGALGIGTGGLGAFYPVSFIEILRVMLNQFQSDQYLLPDGSSSALEKLYEAEVNTPDGRSVSLASEAKLNLSTQVIGVQADQGSPVLEFKDQDGTISSKKFDAVIVTTTPQAMQDIGVLQYKTDVEQLIAPEVANGVENLNLVSSSKLFIRTATKFWLDEQGNPRKEQRADGSWGVIPQNIQTDGSAHGIYCLDYPNTDHGVVALSYSWGANSDELVHKTPQERLEEFKTHIKTISPEFAANLVAVNDEIHCIDWQNKPGYYGAFKLNYPGAEVSQQEALYQFQDVSNGVVLAGDSLSHMGGWVEGALQTGIHAACAVAKYLGGTVAEGSPLELNKQRFHYGAPAKAADLFESSRMLALSASQAVGEIAAGRISATAYIGAVLGRAKHLSGLNTLITLNEEAALSAARQVDEDRALGRPLKPLAGLPIVVKDNINTNNLPTTAGTVALRHFTPAQSSPVLQLLLDAGAILVGKANMHELSFGVTSTNLSSFAGPVRNPYNRDFIPGGSSGGTAAAIAARIVPAGLGTDTGGATRIPAALSGVVGFRPSVGNGGLQRRYSAEGVVPVSATRDTVGPMARTVKDVALLDAVIGQVDMPEPLPLSGLRFGVPNILWSGLDKDVADAMQMAKSKLSAAGVVFVEVDMPELLALNDKVSFPIAVHESAVGIPGYLRANGVEGVTLDSMADQISSPDVRGLFHAVKADAFGGMYSDALKVYRPQLCALYDDYFRKNQVDVLFFPTTPVSAIPIDLLRGSSSLSINGGAPVDVFSSIARNTEPGSNAGLPGLSLPVGLTPAGLPVGMEIDGPVGSDARLLSIGLSVDALFGSLPEPKL